MGEFIQAYVDLHPLFQVVAFSGAVLGVLAISVMVIVAAEVATPSMRKLLAALIILVSAGLGATDGTLGSTSRGTVGISLIKMDLPRRSDVDVSWERGVPSARVLGNDHYHVSSVSTVGNVVTVMVTPE